MLESITGHPVRSGIIAVVIFVIVIYFSSGSGSQTTTSQTTDPSAVAAAASIQNAQLAANSHNSDVAASLQANSDNIGGQITLATIAANTQNFIANLQATIASEQINAHSQDLALTSTLQAQVAQAQLDNAAAMKANDNATQVQNTKSLTDALIHSADNNFNLQAQQNYLNYSQNVTIASLYASH